MIRAAYPKALNKQIYKAGSKRQRRWTGVGASPEPRPQRATRQPDGVLDMAEKPAGTAPEGKGPLAPTSAGLQSGYLVKGTCRHGSERTG